MSHVGRPLGLLCLLALTACAGTGPTEPDAETADRIAAVLPAEAVQSGFTVAAPGVDEVSLQAFTDDVEEIRSAGGTWVRFAVRSYDVLDSWGEGDAMHWDEAALGRIDAAVDIARRAGLHIYFITADSYRSDVVGDRYRAMMEQYWDVLAARLGDRVDVWQVFNEADGTHFGTHAELPQPLPRTYLADLRDLLTLAGKTIKHRAPGVIVTTNAGGFPLGDVTEKRWHRYFDALAPALDVLAVGAYPQTDGTLISEMPARVDRLSESFGTPVIVAEVGLQTCTGCFSEDEQGSALSETLHRLADSQAVLVLVYTLRDDGESQFGIFTGDGAPKTGTEAIIDALPDGTS